MPEETILELKAKAFDIINKRIQLMQSYNSLDQQLNEVLQQINSVSPVESLALGGTQEAVDGKQKQTDIKFPEKSPSARTPKQEKIKHKRKDAQGNEEKILAAIKNHCSRTPEIAKETGICYSTCYTILTRLEGQGKIAENAPGKYVLTESE